MALATALVFGGCDDEKRETGESDADADTDTDTNTDTDTDSDTGPDCTQGEYSGDFEITTQSDVATLAGYTSISGELNIDCPSCTDLSELICLTSVGGHFRIMETTALTNLDGLSALISVGGVLSIFGNNSLSNLDGLSALTSVGGLLVISSNPALSNLDGLSALTSVGGEFGLTINNNKALANLDGLGALTWIKHLLITSNLVLPDCEVCELLDQLTTAPTPTEVHDNLDDSCTPVPTGCP